MAFLFNNVFTTEQLQYINTLPSVLQAREQLLTNNEVRFTIQLTEDLKQSLANCFQFDFTNVSEIPMRWIKGDTKPHVDVGAKTFKDTYLVYMNNNQGNFIINETAYPIDANVGFKFNEGIPHCAIQTGEIPRLLLGPFNEFAEPVGLPPSIAYFQSEADALDGSTGILGYSYGFVVAGGDFGYTFWRIQSNSNGEASPQNVIYENGDPLIDNGGEYRLFPSSPCFLEGSKILSLMGGEEVYVPIEKLQKGDLIKTSRNGYKKIEVIGKGTIVNKGDGARIEERLYKCSKDKYPELSEDLYITGFHSILVDNLTDAQKETIIKTMGKLYSTENKYRLIAYADERAEPWSSEGKFTIWHLALENTDRRMNYGIYANGGLLVESCSIHYLTHYANMSI